MSWPLGVGSLSKPLRSLRGGGRTYGRTDGRTDVRTDGRTDSPCILQDFVPSGSLRGRCPKSVSHQISMDFRARLHSHSGSQIRTTRKTLIGHCCFRFCMLACSSKITHAIFFVILCLFFCLIFPNFLELILLQILHQVRYI